jgi:hypothetical protein
MGAFDQQERAGELDDVYPVESTTFDCSIEEGS